MPYTLGPMKRPWIPEKTADVGIADHGSIVLLHPHTQAARKYLSEHAPEDAQWFGVALVVETRYANDWLVHLVDEGLTIQPRLS